MRNPRRAAQGLHSALPRTQRNGKNAEDGKPQRTAEGKQKIRHEDLAEPPRIHWGRIQDRKRPLHLKA